MDDNYVITGIKINKLSLNFSGEDDIFPLTYHLR